LPATAVRDIVDRMTTPEAAQRRQTAVSRFEQQTHRADGPAIVENLDLGLDLLRDLCYTRIHRDVERAFGVDSLIEPVSAIKAELETKRQIDIYLTAEAVAFVRLAGYLAADPSWIESWLGALRLDVHAEHPGVFDQLQAYVDQAASDRRLAFSTALERALAEARKAPLVLYQLLPPAVAIVVATAFADSAHADLARGGQRLILSALSDCRACHGALLPPGATCNQCGNPLWKFAWLTGE
jgi:hypothetical protein